MVRPGAGQAEKQSAARKGRNGQRASAALQQRTAQNGSVSAKSQSADAQYLRGDRKPPAPTADAAKTLLSSGVNPLGAAAQGKAAYTPPTTAQKKAAREDTAAQKSVVRLPTAAEKKAEKKASAPEIARNAVFSGLSQFNKGLASTLDFFMPTDFLGEYDPFSRLNDYYAKENEYFGQRMADSVSDRSRAAQVAAEVGAGTVAALPNAVLALMSAGTSLAAQGTTQGLQAASAAANSGIAGAVGNAVSEMIKNPLYWSSYLQTAGTDYEKAKANGASDLEATATALISSALNAGIEISGGLEGLPDQVKSGGVRAVGNWVKMHAGRGQGGSSAKHRDRYHAEGRIRPLQRELLPDERGRHCKPEAGAERVCDGRGGRRCAGRGTDWCCIRPECGSRMRTTAALGSRAG